MHRLIPLALLLVCASLAAPAWADCVRDPQGRCLTPDPLLTPGAADPRVTQDTIGQTICQPGYTRRVRHKRGSGRAWHLARYGLVQQPGQGYVIDHLVPLEVGGADVDANLWPQSGVTTPWNAGVKDHLEHVIHYKVCAGELTLAEGQTVFLGDWGLGYVQYIGVP